jgi:hypothetical protein
VDPRRAQMLQVAICATLQPESDLRRSTLATYPTPKEPNSLGQLLGECNHIVPHQPESSFLIILGMPDGTWQFRSRQPSGFEEMR